MNHPTSWLQSGLEQLDVPLIIVASDRRIAYANPAARRLFGVTPGSLEGAGLERLVVAERKGELRNIEDVLKGGSARRVRSMVRREDGGRLDVTMSVEPCFDASGRVEAASVRYELIAASGRMSAAPEARPSEARQPEAWTPVQSGAVPSVESRGLIREPSLVPPVVSGPAPVARRPASDQAGARPISARAPEGARPISARAPEGAPRQPTSVFPLHGGAPFGNRPTTVLPSLQTTDLEARLKRLGQHLQWLDERMVQPASGAPLDDSQERARVLMVIAEARSELRRALEELKQKSPSLPPLPAPPKLPTL